MKNIRLSVALVTRNRPHSLRRCLQSVREQSVQPFELVVSDDSDLDIARDTEAVVSGFGARYLAGPRHGLYANRNAAALACTGTHVRTMDDDHTFAPDHFAKCHEAIADGPTSVWTTGEITYVDGAYTGRVATANQLHPSGVGGSVHTVSDNWAIADGSTIYPREIFDQGLRMVEAFGFGSTYLEFGSYLYARGFRSRCIPNTCVEHQVSRSDIPARDPRSILFASLCFNLGFRPNRLNACRFAAAFLLRHFSIASQFSSILREVRQRWFVSR